MALVEQIEAEADTPGAVETLRLVFTDPHGVLRGKTLTVAAVRSAFTSGVRVPSTLLLKDLSHRTVFPVWSEDGDAPMHGAGDILMVPDATTFQRLPHSSHSAMMQCDVVHLSGAPIDFAARGLLQQAVDRLAQRGMRAVMGLEVEFQVFEVTDPALEHGDTTMPGRAPVTRAVNQGYQFLTESRYDAAEHILDELRRAAQAMGMPLRTVEIEMGPSQFEFTFAPGDPVAIADMAVTFRTMVRETCARRGLLASFMPKPRLANAAANGWHIHQSITDEDGRNLMTPQDTGLTAQASGWIAGLIAHANAACLATNPTVNSYKRFSAYQLAPNRIGWGHDNRGAMLRAIMAPADAASRVENRAADSSVNPYFALAFQIIAGLDGIERGLSAPQPLSDPYDAQADPLPGSLIQAIEAFEGSELFRDVLGVEFVSYLSRLKRAEWTRYIETISQWEQDEYFDAL